MANARNKYNYVLKERKKILEEVKELKNHKIIKRYLLLHEKNRELEKQESKIKQELIYNKFCSCKHLLVYTEFNDDSFLKNYDRTFACVKCGINSSVLKTHRDFLSDENKTMYDYLVDNPFLERNIELTTPCDLIFAKKAFEKVREKYPNTSSEIFKKYFYVALKFNVDKINIKKMNK